MSRITEETPLLPDSTADGSGSLGDEPDTDAVERHQRRCTRAIFILTWHSVLLAVFLLVSNAIMVAIYYARTGELAPWERQLALAGLMCTLLVTGLISFFNLARLYLWNRPMWLWLNLILDLAIAFYSIGTGSQGLGNYGWGSSDPLWFIRINWVISLLAVIIGLIHLTLFLVRCFLSFSYPPWRGYRNWKFPTGRLSVEFKVEFTRQAEDPEALLDATASGTGIQAEAVAQE